MQNDGHKWVEVTDLAEGLQYGDEVYGFAAGLVRFDGEITHHSAQKVVVTKHGGGTIDVFPSNLKGGSNPMRGIRGATPPLKITIHRCDSPGHGRHRFSHTETITVTVPKD